MFVSHVEMCASSFYKRFLFRKRVWTPLSAAHALISDYLWQLRLGAGGSPFSFFISWRYRLSTVLFSFVLIYKVPWLNNLLYFSENNWQVRRNVILYLVANPKLSRLLSIAFQSWFHSLSAPGCLQRLLTVKPFVYNSSSLSWLKHPHLHDECRSSLLESNVYVVISKYSNDLSTPLAADLEVREVLLASWLSLLACCSLVC